MNSVIQQFSAHWEVSENQVESKFVLLSYWALVCEMSSASKNWRQTERKSRGTYTSVTAEAVKDDGKTRQDTDREEPGNVQ